jgi:hypothetical protein
VLLEYVYLNSAMRQLGCRSDATGSGPDDRDFLT